MTLCDVLDHDTKFLNCTVCRLPIRLGEEPHYVLGSTRRVFHPACVLVFTLTEEKP